MCIVKDLKVFYIGMVLFALMIFYFFHIQGGADQVHVETPEDQNSPMHARRSSGGRNINGKDIFYHTQSV